jgi:hypothetical protein
MRTFTRSFTLAVLPVLTAMVGLVGCSTETPMPVTGTVSLAVIPGADQGGRPFSTAMTQEVTTQPVWAGDADGTGSALITVNLGQREICWAVSVSAIDLPATSSHIHRAAPGVRGPIVVGLSAPDATGVSQGCSSGLDADLLREILTTPDAFYVNVHNAPYPAGAVRGQLP